MTIFYVGWPCPECKRSIHSHTGPVGNFCPKCKKCAECVKYDEVTDTFCAECKPEAHPVEIEEILHGRAGVSDYIYTEASKI